MKDKPLKGTYKRTVHDGSRSYSIVMPNPEHGKGKHYNPGKARLGSIRWMLKKMGIII